MKGIKGWLGATVLGLITTGVIFIIAIGLVVPFEKVTEKVICHFPNHDELVTKTCKCWYLEKHSETKPTELGLGCNVNHFTGLVNTTMPRCG